MEKTNTALYGVKVPGAILIKSGDIESATNR